MCEIRHISYLYSFHYQGKLVFQLACLCPPINTQSIPTNTCCCMFPHLKHTLDRNVLGISFGTGTWLSFQRPCRLDEDICTLKTCKDSLKLSKTKTKLLLKFGNDYESPMPNGKRITLARWIPQVHVRSDHSPLPDKRLDILWRG